MRTPHDLRVPSWSENRSHRERFSARIYTISPGVSRFAMSIEHGVDLEQFAAFAEHAGENPDEIQFELGARAAYEGRAGHSLAKVDEFALGGETVERPTREYTFPLGAWKEVEEAAGFVGPTDRPEPVEVALAALTGCLNVAVSFTALHEGIDLEGIDTEVSLDFDPRIVLFLDDVENSEWTFENVEIDIAVTGDDLTEEDRELLEAGARRSPVWNLMRLGHEMEPRVELGTAEMAADD